MVFLECLAPFDMAKWFYIAVKVGRLVVGEPSKNIGQNVTAQVRVDHETVKSIIMNERATDLAVELFAELYGDGSEIKAHGNNPAGLV